jgi:glycosyltransferase involved in cell wall biosynthesis
VTAGYDQTGSRRRCAVRILVLSAQFPHPDNPTSGIFVQEQAAALRRAGLDARVLTGCEAWLGPSRPLFSLAAIGNFSLTRPRIVWREQGGVPVAKFPTVVLGRLGEAARSLCYDAGLRRVLRVLRNDFPFVLVHAHTGLLDGAAAVAIKQAARVPFVLTEHTGPFSVITRTPAMRRRVRSALVAADRVIAVSSALARKIEEVFPDLERRIEVIPNGVDVDMFRPGPMIRRRAAAAGQPRQVELAALGVAKRQIRWDTPPKVSSHRTLRWREMDSNFRFRCVRRS